MADLVDLDGTCLKSPHVDKNVDELVEYLSDFYLNTLPYIEITTMIRDRIASMAENHHRVLRIVFITGRKDKYIVETKSWIKEHVGLYDGEYEIEFLGFVDHDSYVKSKITRIIELISSSKDYLDRVYDDDEKIIDGVEREIVNIRWCNKVVQLILVRDGKAWQRKIKLNKKRWI